LFLKQGLQRRGSALLVRALYLAYMLEVEFELLKIE
jgi:hypothetical protein